VWLCDPPLHAYTPFAPSRRYSGHGYHRYSSDREAVCHLRALFLPTPARGAAAADLRTRVQPRAQAPARPKAVDTGPGRKRACRRGHGGGGVDQHRAAARADTPGRSRQDVIGWHRGADLAVRPNAARADPAGNHGSTRNCGCRGLFLLGLIFRAPIPPANAVSTASPGDGNPFARADCLPPGQSRIPGTMRQARSYSIVDHALLHGGFLARLSHQTLVLYLFLVVVGDREGRSFYKDASICSILRLSASELCRARDELVASGLIDFRSPSTWVKSLSQRKTLATTSLPSPSPAQRSSDDLVPLRGVVPKGLVSLLQSLEIR